MLSYKTHDVIRQNKYTKTPGNPYHRQDDLEPPLDSAKWMAAYKRVAGAIELIAGAWTPAVEGVWYVGNLCVRYRPLYAGEFAMDGETGWYRYRLRSSDGLLRTLDKDAPSVVLSPSGAIFWMKKDFAAPKRVTIQGLLECLTKWVMKIDVEVTA